MGFPLTHIPCPCGEKMSDPIFVFHIRSVFSSPLIDISGKHSEISIRKADNSQCVKEPYSKQGQRKTDEDQNHKKTVELVISIPSLHKSVKLFFHSGHAFLFYNSRLQKDMGTYLHVSQTNAAALTSILLLSLP